MDDFGACSVFSYICVKIHQAVVVRQMRSLYLTHGNGKGRNVNTVVTVKILTISCSAPLVESVIDEGQNVDPLGM